MKKSLLLIALLCPLWLFAQSESDYRTIKGVVMDSVTNETLIGATVMIDPDAAEAKNLGPKGTITDFDGKFELKVPKAVKYVVVSFVGYKNAKLDVTKTTEFKVMLQPDQEQLTEVVVTGYQQIEKRKSTSAIQTVKMDDIKRIGVASIDQLLEGQVAGMTAIPTNGAPGAPSKMRIRSTVSLTGSTDPLWVLDGMILEGNDIPTDFSDKDNIDNLYNTSIAGVNPADIESITILKDASATAIYGARAANGVIVVTTKKGTAGKMRVNASAAMFVTTRPDLGKLNLMNASEKVDFELGMAANPNLTYQTDRGAVSRILTEYDQLGVYRDGGFNAISSEAQQAINKLRSSGTNWGNQVYQNAVNQQYNISVSGGSESTRYYVSAGYYNEKGTTIGTSFERFNGTMKTDFDLRDNLQLGVSLFLTHSKRGSYLSDTDAFTNASNYTRTVNPYLEAKDENGKYVYDEDIDGLKNNEARLKFNMLEERKNTDYWLKNFAVKPMLSLAYKPVTWLNLSTQVSMQIERSSTEKFADQETYFVRKYREFTAYGDNQYFLPDGGIIQNWNDDMTQYQWKLQGEFNKTFAEMHSVNFMAGFEMRGNKSTSIHTKGFGFDPRSLATKPLIFPEGTTSSASDSKFVQYQKTETENRYLSYYMTASYSYDNRYTIFGSMRFDGSNLFGVAKKYKYLPLWALSAAWNVDRESFMSSADWLSNLKLRISYGLQGNVDKNTSPFVVGDWNTTTILPGNSEPIISVSSPPNQNLRWEKTKNWNVGVDMGVFDNRISFSVDAYYRKSVDLIGMRSIPQENGFEFSTMNWAEATNKGVEFSLSTVNIRAKDFRWTMDFNIAHNTSNVDKIQVRDDSYTPSLEGHSIGTLFKLNTAGLDENGMQMFWKEGQKVSMQEFFNLEDLYGFMTLSNLTAEEYRNLFTYAGTTEPKFTGGFINRFYYKNFDLTISTSFIIDQTMQETPFYNPSATSPGSNYSNRVSQIWSSSNTTGLYPKVLGNNENDAMIYNWYNSDDPANSFKNYDYWFKDMSYLRVNSIRLGYTLPNEVIKKLRLGSARISFEARNPFVIASSYKGYFDPETWGNIYAQPLPKTFSCGLDITF